MQKNIYKILISSLIIIGFTMYYNKFMLADNSLADKLKGRILLQVENNGESWYINPDNLERYYLGRPADAFELMQDLGRGITNENLAKISIAEANFSGTDSDGDGLSDTIEISMGTNKDNSDTDGDGYNDKTEILNNYNPLGQGILNINNELSENLAGIIVLQIEQNGEAWYINPADLKRHYMGRPVDAFNLMRKLGLGITNENLAKINEHQINPEYNSKSIVQYYTTPAQNNTARKYTEINNRYSIEYPKDWTIKKYQDSPNTIYITDSKRDFFLENKAVIFITYVQKNKNLELNNFKIASKPQSTKTIDENLTINNNEAIKQAFEYDQTYEITTTIEKNPQEFIIATLVTANRNDSYYTEKYNNMINSLEFASSACQTCQ